MHQLAAAAAAGGEDKVAGAGVENIGVPQGAGLGEDRGEEVNGNVLGK